MYKYKYNFPPLGGEEIITNSIDIVRSAAYFGIVHKIRTVDISIFQIGNLSGRY